MIFSHFFHVICYAKSERLSWCQKRPLFRTDDFLSSILFYSDWYRLVFGPTVNAYNLIFTFRISRNVTLYIRTDLVEDDLYVEKKNGIFVTKQSMDCFGCWLSKRQFWKIVADLIFHRSRFASDFCANVDGQYILFFCLVPKIIDTTVNYFSEEQEDVTSHCTPKFDTNFV